MGQKQSNYAQEKQTPAKQAKKTASLAAKQQASGSHVAKQPDKVASSPVKQSKSPSRSAPSVAKTTTEDEEEQIVEPAATDNAPHIKQTAQVETIKIQRPEDQQPGKHHRAAKEYKDWADRTAFSFPPKK